MNSSAFFLTPELTARVDGCQKMHPSSRAVNSGAFLTPVNSGVKKCTRVHGPSTRAVNSGSGNRALVFRADLLENSG